MRKILIIDDDQEILTSLSALLNEGGYHACGVSSEKNAIDELTSENFDLVLLDIVMPQTSGIDLLPELRRLNPRTPVIMITGFPSTDDAVAAIKKGACDYITKPFKPEELFYKIGKAIEKTKFEKYPNTSSVDNLLNVLANPIRKNILNIISAKTNMRLAEIAKDLKIADHSKVVFHLKLLKEGKLLEQNKERAYALTPQGKKVLDCLGIMQSYLQK